MEDLLVTDRLRILNLKGIEVPLSTKNNVIYVETRLMPPAIRVLPTPMKPDLPESGQLILSVAVALLCEKADTWVGKL